MHAAQLQATAFTIRLNGLANRIISRDVGVQPHHRPTATKQPADTPIRANALWDTGATKSCISQSLVDQLSIVAVGKTNLKHADGTSECLQYLVDIDLPNGVRVKAALVAALPIDKEFDVVIGMDVIALGDFTITNAGGITWVSFRMPSVGRVDYVKDLYREQAKGVPLNRPCPFCTSGKKFKMCCKLAWGI